MNKRGLVLMAITSAIAPLTGCALTHGQQHAGLVQAGIRVDSWQPHKPTLEEFYLGMTGA